jgi:hypothetical protein
VIVADAGSYSDMVFGLVHLLGMEYRPALADLQDQRLWRADASADYGPLNTAARGRVDLSRVRRHWQDVLRVVGSVYTGAVSTYDVLRVLQREGSLTSLGEAVASYGRIFKSLHVLAFAGATSRACATSKKGATHWQQPSSTARRASSTSTTTRAWKTSWAPSGWSSTASCSGTRCTWTPPLGASGLLGHQVLGEDVARLSPFVRRHLNVHGRYSFRLFELSGDLRALRDPEASDDDHDDA